MFFLIYVSSATKPFSKPELTELLRKSREKNSLQDITGLLLYSDGNFIQMLEGPEPAVRRLVEVIKMDPRHHGIIVLIEGQQGDRDFPEWSMGFRDGAAAGVLPGYTKFLERGEQKPPHNLEASAFVGLFKTFKKNVA